MGQSPPGETYNESGNGVPFYQGNRDFGYRFPTARVFCSAPTRFADTRDILVSVRAPVGALNIALEKCCIGRGVAALRMKNHSNGFLFYFLATQDDLWNRFNSEGTVFGCLNKSEFNKIDLVIPSDDVLAGFDRFVVSIEAMLWKNEEENRRLSGIRDSLLPKLMDGRIRTGGEL
jgi:type I restriction enzyme S subunit